MPNGVFVPGEIMCSSATALAPHPHNIYYNLFFFFLFPCRFVKEKRPTISPNFNFLGQLLDFEKKIKTQGDQVPAAVCKLKLQLDLGCGANENYLALATAEMPLPQSPQQAHPTSEEPPQSSYLEETPLLQGLNGLHVSHREDSTKIKRSFSLDIKSMSYCGTASLASTQEDSKEFYKPAASLEGGSKKCQFSPVEEVSEQTPEASPDREEAKRVQELPAGSRQKEDKHWQPQQMSSRSSFLAQRSLATPLFRSGSMEDHRKTNFLFGLSSSQQHLAKPALGLKDWHSDILATQASSLTGSWYFTSDVPSHFYSASTLYSAGAFAAYSCGQLPTDPSCAVRRRQKPCARGDSRRSWHEESPFEKQFKRRSCQMEFGGSLVDSRSREELGKVGSQTTFSGSMEVIEVS